MAAAEVVVPVVPPPPLLRLGEIIWEMGKSLITESTAAKDRWRNFIRPCAIMSLRHTHDNVQMPSEDVRARTQCSDTGPEDLALEGAGASAVTRSK